jgi:hypothetical protein
MIGGFLPQEILSGFYNPSDTKTITQPFANENVYNQFKQHGLKIIGKDGTNEWHHSAIDNLLSKINEQVEPKDRCTSVTYSNDDNKIITHFTNYNVEIKLKTTKESYPPKFVWSIEKKPKDSTLFSQNTKKDIKNVNMDFEMETFNSSVKNPDNSTQNALPIVKKSKCTIF